MTPRYSAFIDEARTAVAAGREPNLDALQTRLRAAAKRERLQADATGRAEIDQAEKHALEQLKRVVTVHRARLLLAREPAAPQLPTPAVVEPLRRTLLRTRPTISGNMDVRRTEDGETLLLGWDAVSAVASWEVRFSERADARAEYTVSEELTLPATSTSVEVPLGERTMRVHVLGRGRDGRLVRRALISALTREAWGDRWERRASAS